MISQDSMEWLTNNVHDNSTLNSSAKKPKFIKMYGKNKSKMVWYKVIKSNQDGSEILTPATPAEIKFWNLK